MTVLAERKAGFRRLAESWQPSETIDAEIENRISRLRDLAATVRNSPTFEAERHPELLEKLDSALKDQITRVQHRPQHERLELATRLAQRDSPVVAELAAALAGSRSEQLISDRIRGLSAATGHSQAA